MVQNFFGLNFAYLIHYFTKKRGTYPLFSCMIPPLEKQNQLLPHDLVTKTKSITYSMNKSSMLSLYTFLQPSKLCIIVSQVSGIFKALALSNYLYLTDVQVFYLQNTSWNLRLNVIMVHLCV